MTDQPKPPPAADLPAPEGYEWVEVGSYASGDDRYRRPQMFYEHWLPSASGDSEGGCWSNGSDPYRAWTRGDHPLQPRRCAWERTYVLRPSPSRRTGAVPDDAGD